MKFISTLLLVLVFLPSCKDSEIRIDHPFAKQVPVAFGTSLDECKKVFRKLSEAQPKEHYPDFAFEYPTYAIEIEPKNSFIGKDGFFMVGFYLLGFDNDRLAKISLHGIRDDKGYNTPISESHFKSISAASCDRFIGCDNFNFPNTIDASNWRELSTDQYDITLQLDWPGKQQFLYEVKLNK